MNGRCLPVLLPHPRHRPGPKLIHEPKHEAFKHPISDFVMTHIVRGSATWKVSGMTTYNFLPVIAMAAPWAKARLKPARRSFRDIQQALEAPT